MSVFLDALGFILDERALILDKTIEHLVLSLVALAVSIAIAVPVGVLLGHLHRGSFLAVNVANVGRALPTLVVIAVGFVLFGIGFTTVMVSLVVLAVPPILTNAYVAVDEVEPDAVEAARGMGMTPLQVLRRVELPLALPEILAGVRIAFTTTVGLATLAFFAGGGGLGEQIYSQAAGTGGLYFKSNVVVAGGLAVLLAAVGDLIILTGQRLALPWRRAVST